jgi:hypothetical protein
MATRCRHPKEKITERTCCWSGCVNLYKDHDERPHGGVTYRERCEVCGAERATECNGGQSVTSGWYYAEDDEE